MRFSAERHPLEAFTCLNTLVTGYADDEMMGSPADSTLAFNYQFEDCILRTPRVETADSVHFTRVSYEDVKDTTQTATKHFLKIDTDNLRYDFRLDSVSIAIDKANPATALPTDRLGIRRDDKPDIGAYEYVKP